MREKKGTEDSAPAEAQGALRKGSITSKLARVQQRLQRGQAFRGAQAEKAILSPHSAQVSATISMQRWKYRGANQDKNASRQARRTLQASLLIHQ
eukprot:1079573-Pelagomonas_calceolata.AAC.11